MSTNISKQKREDLLNKIKEIRTFIASAPQDENTGNLLSYWKRQGASGMDEVKKLSEQSAKAPRAAFTGERNYTKQQLDAFLGDVSDFDDI